MLSAERACRSCKAPFTPHRPMQAVCGLKCAKAELAKDKAQERDKLRARREAIKTRQQWLAECQAIVNKYARLRDRNLPCVSCGRSPNWGGQWHGSHFRSVGAASAVRLNLWNVHRACSPCNVHLSGNLLGYRPRLIERIGNDKVQWLEAQNQLVRYEVDYLKRFKAVMGKRLRRLEKRLEK